MSPKSNTIVKAEAEIFTIETAAAKLGLTEFRVRSAIRAGELKTTLHPIKDGSKTNRHEFTQANLDEWRNGMIKGSRRADGRNKYNVYMTPAEYDKVMAALVEAKLEVPVTRANVAKVATETEAVEA